MFVTHRLAEIRISVCVTREREGQDHYRLAARHQRVQHGQCCAADVGVLQRTGRGVGSCQGLILLVLMLNAKVLHSKVTQPLQSYASGQVLDALRWRDELQVHPRHPLFA